MSEEQKAPEMSAAEELKSILDAAVEEKANKADLEGFVKAEELEGVVKAEQLEEVKAAQDAAVQEAVEAVKAEMVEAIENKFAQAPAIVTSNKTKESNVIYDLKSADMTEKAQQVLSFKAVNTTDEATDGLPTPSFGIYSDLQYQNVFRGIASELTIGAGSSFVIPKLALASNYDQNAGSYTEASTLTEQSANIKEYNSLARISQAAVEDIVGLDQFVGSDMVREIGQQESDQIVTTLDAATVTEVNTGVAADNPSDFGKYADLMAAVSSQYWSNATWVMSPEAWASLSALSQSGTGSPLVLDPVMGGFMLYGRPIRVSESLDAGTNANDNSVYFGDFSRGLVIGNRREVMMGRTLDESIGHVTYWARMRSGQLVREASALARFNTAA